MARQAAVWCCAALLAIVSLAGCQGAAPASAPATARWLAGLPSLPDAVVDVTGNETDLGGDRPFVAYHSDLAPAAARRTYERALEDAGYVLVGSRGAWFVFERAEDLVILVQFGVSGPPTSVLVVEGNAADVAAATVAPTETVVAPRPVGTPEPASALPQGNRGVANGNGKGNANGQGNGNGNGSANGTGNGQGGANGNGNANGQGNGNGNATGNGQGNGNGNGAGNGNGQGGTNGSGNANGAGGNPTPANGQANGNGNAKGNGNANGQGNGNANGSGNATGNGAGAEPNPASGNAGGNGNTGSNGAGNGGGSGNETGNGGTGGNGTGSSNGNGSGNGNANGRSGASPTVSSPAAGG